MTGQLGQVVLRPPLLRQPSGPAPPFALLLPLDLLQQQSVLQPMFLLLTRGLGRDSRGPRLHDETLTGGERTVTTDLGLHLLPHQPHHLLPGPGQQPQVGRQALADHLSQTFPRLTGPVRGLAPALTVHTGVLAQPGRDLTDGGGAVEVEARGLSSPGLVLEAVPLERGPGRLQLHLLLHLLPPSRVLGREYAFL